ncbi:MAG: flagellar hook capping protein [Phycisphaerae bacterium]|nr:flagellar hook capping protein [Phycisphaerae bacterium]
MAISALGQSSGEITTNYLNLLITQLQNQNPMDPLNNNEMASQLAQLSQLEQIENMNRTFGAVLASTQRDQAAELIGKRVSYFPTDATEAVVGRVDRVDLTGEQIMLHVGNAVVPLDEIGSIEE